MYQFTENYLPVNSLSPAMVIGYYLLGILTIHLLTSMVIFRLIVCSTINEYYLFYFPVSCRTISVIYLVKKINH